MNALRKTPEPVAAGEVKWTARRYRYADGGCYRKDLYTIWIDGIAPRPMAAGGALVLRDGRAIAWIGLPGLCKPKEIIDHSDGYVWGGTIREALAKLKAAYPHRPA